MKSNAGGDGCPAGFPSETASLFSNSHIPEHPDRVHDPAIPKGWGLVLVATMALIVAFKDD